jgi:hypothetical protein
VLINTERNGQLYTPKTELKRFGVLIVLVSTFNRKLYNNARHQPVESKNVTVMFTFAVLRMTQLRLSKNSLNYQYGAVQN